MSPQGVLPILEEYVTRGWTPDVSGHDTAIVESFTLLDVEGLKMFAFVDDLIDEFARRCPPGVRRQTDCQSSDESAGVGLRLEGEAEAAQASRYEAP